MSPTDGPSSDCRCLLVPAFRSLPASGKCRLSSVASCRSKLPRHAVSSGLTFYENGAIFQSPRVDLRPSSATAPLGALYFPSPRMFVPSGAPFRRSGRLSRPEPFCRPPSKGGFGRPRNGAAPRREAENLLPRSVLHLLFAADGSIICCGFCEI